MHGEPWSQECVLHIVIGSPKKKEEKEEMVETSCLFCLEELKEFEGSTNGLRCGCEVHCHSSCLQAWFQQKNQIECPICHRVNIVNPIQSREFVILRIQNPEREERYRHIQSHEKCIGFCCLTIVFWWLGAVILEYAL